VIASQFKVCCWEIPRVQGPVNAIGGDEMLADGSKRLYKVSPSILGSNTKRS
jgi:hypothetical protein